MTDLTHHFKVLRFFVPPTLWLKIMSLAAIGVAIGLAPLVNSLAKDEVTWLPHYLAVSVSAGFGFVQGHVLRLVRSWPASILVPGMLTVTIRTAIATVLLMALSFVGLLTVIDGLNGYSPMLCVGAGCLALMIGAGVFDQAVSVSIVMLFILIVTRATGDQVLLVLQSPIADWSLAALAALACAALMYQYRKPALSSGGLPTLAPAVRTSQVEDIRLPRMAFLDSLTPADLSHPFRAAFHHSTKQRAVNELGLVGFLAFLTGTSIIMAGESLRDFVNGTALLVVICVAFLPWFQRPQFGAMQETLWLAGTHDNRRKLVTGAFLQMIALPIRICLIAAAGYSLILLASDQHTMGYAVFAMLILAPASAAIMLMLILTLRNSLGQAATGQLLFFGLATAIVPGLMNIVALVFVTERPVTQALPLALIISVTLIAASVFVTAEVLSRQRQWFK